MSDSVDNRCPDCGHELKIGEWPYCKGIQNAHEQPRGMQTWKPYWDVNIGDDGPIYITSWQQKQNLMKPHWRKDQLIQTRERGELSKHNWRRKN